MRIVIEMDEDDMCGPDICEALEELLPEVIGSDDFSVYEIADD